MKTQISLFKALSTIGIWIHSTSHKLRRYGARIYVSGKITGLDDAECFGNFQFISARVKRMGFIAVNPYTLFPKGWTWRKYMVYDIWELILCRSAYFMDNYMDSRGAKIEHRIAKMTGKKCYYERTIYTLAKLTK